MARAKKWSEGAENGGPSIKFKLAEYIDHLREMYSEMKFSVSMFGPNCSSGSKSQLNFKKTGDEAQPATGPNKVKKQTPAKKPGATAPQVTKAKECSVCKKKHVEFYHNCPLLKDIQWGKAQLPNVCCKLCLGRSNPAGKCVKGDNCFMYTSLQGNTYNLLYTQHKETHFSICTHCPPRKIKSQVKDQLISAMRFRAATPPQNR